MFKQYLDTPYDIDENGKCFSHLSNKYLTPQMTNKYPTYNLTIEGKKKKTKIHRMVAEAFLPRIEGKDIVNHKDGDTKNYRLSNLEWRDHQENSIHAVETGLRPKGDQKINKYQDNLPGEEWLPVKDYSNYVISSCGRIMNIKTKRLLKQVIGNNGYYEVNLWKNNHGTTTQIHRLVYSHFYDDFDLQGYVINHKDGDKLNNNKSNLEKNTYQENNLHAVYAIKTNSCIRPVLQYDKEMNFIAEYPSIAEAQRALGIKNVSRAAKNNLTAGGFYWKYK